MNQNTGTTNYQGLLNQMEQSAQEEIKSIERDALERREHLLKGAEGQAAMLRNQTLKKAEGEATVEAHRLLVATRREVADALANERTRWYDDVFDEAGKRLVVIREKPEYRVILAGLIAEADTAIGRKERILHIDPRDGSLVRDILAKESPAGEIVPRVEPDLSTAGGVMVTTVDGRVLADNTIENRLKQAREILRVELFRDISGG